MEETLLPTLSLIFDVPQNPYRVYINIKFRHLCKGSNVIMWLNKEQKHALH